MPAAEHARRVQASDELPPHDHASRRDRLRSMLGSDDAADWLLVTDPRNVRYLSGFRGSSGQVLVGPDEVADRLITDPRYEARAPIESPDLALELSRDPVAVAVAVAAVAAADGARLGLEATRVSWEQARAAERRAIETGVTVVPIVDAVESLRAVKDDAEVARLQHACELTASALTWLFAEVVRPGRSEQELATLLERRFIDLGADDVAFPSIVAAGPSGAVPHHEPGPRELAAGELLTVDCGALVDGYHADITRTVAVGPVSDTLREIHEVVRDAQERGRAAAVAQAMARDVDAAAREVIAAAGYGDRFVHGTGHGVGLEVHEAPAVAATSAATLVPGTALTVEPGIYLPGIGGVRIEDTIVVTADGAPRTLADLPRELQTV